MNALAPLPVSPPIASDADAAAAIAEIGSIRIALKRIEASASEAVAKAKQAAEDKATPLIAAETSLETRLRAYCESERLRLTGYGTSKTADFPTGAVHWRDSVEVCEFDEATEKKIVGPLKRAIIAKLTKLLGFWAPFVTVGVKLSKVALKSPTLDPDTKAKLRRRGIRFVKPPEAFLVAPMGAELSDRPDPA